MKYHSGVVPHTKYETRRTSTASGNRTEAKKVKPTRTRSAG